ncbi:MAG: hypothetical protein FJW66_01575 [Actinobacteria bacterium]|nr:hypothetical protein [Actinomycetota bacterium]
MYKNKKSFKENFHYWFDNMMSGGTLSIIGFLALITLVFIIVTTVVLWLINLVPEKSFIELLWLNIFKTLNSGTLDNARSVQLNFAISLLIALGSIFITSLLIGVLTSGIQQKIWALRKGRSRVIERNHTVILGWSDIVFTLMRELMEANKNQKKFTLVIMGNKDKVEMEESVRERVKPRGNIRVICRSGNPLDLNDLQILSLPLAKSIIIIENEDTQIFKTLLAVNNSTSKSPDRNFNIVSLINENRNLDSGRIASGGRANFILNKDFIAKLIAQTCYQPGLSLVYNDLLNFKGDEIYIANFKELGGKTFRESIFMFDKSSVIGLYTGGVARLNPPPDTVIKENDRIIVISADDDASILSEIQDPGINYSSINISGKTAGFKDNDIGKKNTRKEKILVLGWNDKAPTVIGELKKYISPGSEIRIAAESGFLKDFSKLQNKSQDDTKETETGEIDLKFTAGDISSSEFLGELTRQNYDHIVVLAYPGMDIQDADSITLMALIHLRDIAEKNNLKYSITSEMLDLNNRELAKVAKVNDFIVSEKLVSLMLAQISENPLLASIFEDLLSESGAEIYLKDVEEFIDPVHPINFHTVAEAAARMNSLAIGYKEASLENSEEKNFGIHLNPDRLKMIDFKHGDLIIVLTESLI